MIGLRISIPGHAQWQEPETFKDDHRDGRLLPRWYTCSVGSGMVFGGWLLLWYWVGLYGGVAVCLLAAALTSLCLFLLLPLAMKAQGSRVEIWSFGIGWCWGVCSGSIAFRSVQSFAWFVEYAHHVLSLSRYDGELPFEVGVPEGIWRDKVTAILLAKGI